MPEVACCQPVRRRSGQRRPRCTSSHHPTERTAGRARHQANPPAHRTPADGGSSSATAGYRHTGSTGAGGSASGLRRRRTRPGHLDPAGQRIRITQRGGMRVTQVNLSRRTIRPDDRPGMSRLHPTSVTRVHLNDHPSHDHKPNPNAVTTRRTGDHTDHHGRNHDHVSTDEVLKRLSHPARDATATAAQPATRPPQPVLSCMNTGTTESASTRSVATGSL